MADNYTFPGWICGILPGICVFLKNILPPGEFCVIIEVELFRRDCGNTQHERNYSHDSIYISRYTPPEA